MLIDIIVSVILVLIIGGAITYIVRSKKRGEKCVGCPYAKQCASRQGNNCTGSSCTGSSCTGSSCTGGSCTGGSCTGGNCTGSRDHTHTENQE